MMTSRRKYNKTFLGHTAPLNPLSSSALDFGQLQLSLFFSLSVIFLQCLGSLPCCMTHVWPGLRTHAFFCTLKYSGEELITSMTAGCPGLVAAKQVQSPVYTKLHMRVCFFVVLFFAAMVCLGQRAASSFPF